VWPVLGPAGILLNILWPVFRPEGLKGLRRIRAHNFIIIVIS